MDPIEIYGELLFGRRLRLRVLLWTYAQTQAFNQTEAARGVDYSSSGEVGKELDRLAGIGMLRKFGRLHRVGPQNYTCVTDHPGWAIAEAAKIAIEKAVTESKTVPPEQDHLGSTTASRTIGGDVVRQ